MSIFSSTAFQTRWTSVAKNRTESGHRSKLLALSRMCRLVMRSVSDLACVVGFLFLNFPDFGDIRKSTLSSRPSLLSFACRDLYVCCHAHLHSHQRQLSSEKSTTYSNCSAAIFDGKPCTAKVSHVMLRRRATI